MTTIGRDSKGQWCARVLDPKTCGTRWLVLEGPGDFADQLANVEFVFTGQSKKRTIEIAGSSEEVQKCVEDGIELAVTLDDIIDPPPWIRQAVAKEIRVDRRSRQAKMRTDTLDSDDEDE